MSTTNGNLQIKKFSSSGELYILQYPSFSFSSNKTLFVNRNKKYLKNGNCSSKTVWHPTARHGFGRWIWKDVSSVPDTIADTSKRRSNSLAEISGLQHRKRLNFQNRMQQKWIARNGTFQNRCYIIFGDFGHENEKMRMRKS